MRPAAPTLLDSSFALPLDGPFTQATALASGVRKKDLTALVAAGYLRRPIRNVYVAAQAPDTLMLRCAMLSLVVPEDAFVCDRTAAWLHAGDQALAPNEHLQVPPVSCFRPSDNGRLRNALAVSGERAILPRDLMELNGIVTTTPLRTAVDLGRLQSSLDMRLWGLDSMLGLGVFTFEELQAEVPRFKRQRGVVTLRVMVLLADGGAQSFGESALRRRWLDAGLPRPRTQIPITVDGRVKFFLDMGLEDLLLAAEYDGEAWHSSDEQVAHDQERRDWLEANRAWHIEVFRGDNCFGHKQDAERRLRLALHDARATLSTRTLIS